MFTLSEFDEVTQPRLRGVEVLASLQREEASWQVVDVCTTPGHWALHLQQRKRRSRKALVGDIVRREHMKAVSPKESTTISQPSHENTEDSKVDPNDLQSFVFVLDNVTNSRKFNQTQKEWLTTFLQGNNSEKSGMVEERLPGSLNGGVLLSRHTSSVACIFFSEQVEKDSPLFLFSIEGKGVLYMWQWENWKWKFLNRISLNRTNTANMFVKSAVFLSTDNMLLWHSEDRMVNAGDIHKSRTPSDSHNGVLMTCELSLEKVEVENGKIQKHLKVGYTTTLGSFSPDSIVLGRFGVVWIRVKLELLSWGTSWGSMLRMELPSEPSCQCIHGISRDLIYLFSSGKLVSYKIDSERPKSSGIIENKVLQLSPSPALEGEKATDLAILFNFVVVLCETSCKFYDSGVGLLISTIDFQSPAVSSPPTGLWMVGGTTAACGIWSHERIWSIWFPSPSKYMSKLEYMSSLNDDKMGLLKATSNVLLNYGPSTRGIASKVMLELATEMKSRGAGEAIVWELLRQRMQNPAMALASLNEDGGTTAIEKEVNHFFDALVGDEAIQYFTPLNSAAVNHLKRIKDSLVPVDQSSISRTGGSLASDNIGQRSATGIEHDDDENSIVINLRPSELYEAALYDSEKCSKLISSLERAFGIKYDTTKKKFEVFGHGPHFQLLLLSEKFLDNFGNEKSPPMFELMVRLYYKAEVTKLVEFVSRVADRAPPNVTGDIKHNMKTRYHLRALLAIPRKSYGEEHILARAALMYRSGDHVGALRMVLADLGERAALNFVKSMIFSKLTPVAINGHLVQKQLFEELLLHRLRQQDEDKGNNEQLLNEIFVFMPETYRITQLLELVQIEVSSSEYKNDFVLDDVLRSQLSSLFGKFVCQPLCWGEF